MILKKIVRFSVGLCIALMLFSPAQAAKVESEKLKMRGIVSNVLLVGSYDEQGRPDQSLIDRAGTCGWIGKDKAFIYVSIRDTRQTSVNIEKTGEFTINMVDKELLPQADFCGTVSANNEGDYFDKLSFTGLKHVKGSAVNAPVLTGSPLVLECSVIQKKQFGEKSHIMYIAEVKKVWVSDGLVTEAGLLNDSFNPVLYYAGAGYYSISKLQGIAEDIHKAKYPDGAK